MDESEVIGWIRKNRRADTRTAVGPGDDCAVISMGGRDMIVSADTIAENVHFSEQTDPYRIGWKAAASGLSDIAACGCEPLGIVAACLIPRGRGGDCLQQIFQGLEDVCALFDIGVAGGDISQSVNNMAVTVTSFGSLHPDGFISRSGAIPGDRVFVTGSLGDSLSGAHLHCVPRIKESLRLRDLCAVHAMIDISDGLFGELKHIAEESAVGFDIEPSAIPLSESVQKTYPENRKEQILHALCDGEDFELLFTVSAGSSGCLVSEWNMHVPVTCIGTCTDVSGEIVFSSDTLGIDVSSLTSYSHEF